MIDPAYLFTDSEWKETVIAWANELAHRDGRDHFSTQDFRRAVLDVIGDRTGTNLHELAAVVDVEGDGMREVSKVEGGYLIEPE